MAIDARFIPITVSLDGSQASADFKQFSDRMIATAKQTGQAIIDASKDVYTKIIASNESVFARYRETQFQMAEIAKQTLEIQEQTAQKISEVSQATDRLSGSLSRLTNEIRDIGEASAASIAKYSRGTAAIQADIEAGFKQFSERLTSTATQIGQAIIDSSSAQSNETLHQMDEAARQSSEMCERIVDKMGEVAEKINRLSEGFERLGEKLGESGEKGESFITKYHEYAASILYTLEILEKLPHSLKEGKARVIEFGESAVGAFGKVKDYLSGLPEKASSAFSNLMSAFTVGPDLGNTFSTIETEIAGLTPAINTSQQSIKAVAEAKSIDDAITQALTDSMKAETVVAEGETVAFLGLDAAMILIPVAVGLIIYGLYRLIAASQELKTATIEEIQALNEKIETLKRAREASDHYKEGQAQSEKTSHTLLDAYHLLSPAAQARIANAKDETEAIKILNEERAKESGLLGQAQNQQAADIIHAFQTRYQEYKQALNDLDSAYSAKMAGPQIDYNHPQLRADLQPERPSQDQLNARYDEARKAAADLLKQVLDLKDGYKELTKGNVDTERATFDFAQSQSRAKGTSQQFGSAIAEMTKIQFPLIGNLKSVGGELGNVEFQAVNAQKAIADLLNGGPAARVNQKIREIAAQAAKMQTTGYEPGLEHAAKTPAEVKQQFADTFLNGATRFAYDATAMNLERDFIKMGHEVAEGESPTKRPARGGGGGGAKIKPPAFDLQADIARAEHGLGEYNKTKKETTAEQQLYERLIDSISPKEKKRIADFHDLQKAIDAVDKLKPHEGIRKQSDEYLRLNKELDDNKKKQEAKAKIDELIKQQSDQFRELNGPETALEKMNRLLSDKEIAGNIDQQTAAILRWKAVFFDAAVKAKQASDNIKSVLATFTDQLNNQELQKTDDPVKKFDAQINKIRADLSKNLMTAEDQANMKKLEETWNNIRRSIQEGIDQRKNDETIRKYNDQVKQLNDQLQQGEHLTQSQTLERRLQRREFGEITSIQEQQLRNLTRQVEEQQKLEEETKKVKDALTNAFQQGLEHGPKAFFKSLFDTFKQTLIKMESEWAASKVMEFLYPSKSGESGSKRSPIHSIIDSFRNHDKAAPPRSTQHSVSVTKVPDAATAANTTSLNGLTSRIQNLIQALEAFRSFIPNALKAGSQAGDSPAQVGSPQASGILPAMSSVASAASVTNTNGAKGGAALNQAMSSATNPAVWTAAKKAGAGLLHAFGIGSKAKPGGANGTYSMEDMADLSKFGVKGDADQFGQLISGGGKAADAYKSAKAATGDSAMSSGKLDGLDMGLGVLQGFTNSGGTMGTVESGLFTAGEMAGGPTNPVGLALIASSIGLGLAGKAFGWGRGDQKAIHDAIKSDSLFGGLDIKGSKGDKVLDQVKQIGDQQWPGKVKQHVAQLIHEDQVKQLIDSFGEYDLKNNPNYAQSQLARTRQLSDIGAAENQFTHRAMGGPVAANMPYLVGEKRPELFIPRVDGAIHPDPIGDMTRRVMDNARAKMSAPAGNQGHSQNLLGFAIQSLVEQLSRLTAISPGQVLQTGAQQNPTAISGGLIEGLRQNFGHRRELNGITGA